MVSISVRDEKIWITYVKSWGIFGNKLVASTGTPVAIQNFFLRVGAIRQMVGNS